jgi:predicted esterase
MLLAGLLLVGLTFYDLKLLAGAQDAFIVVRWVRFVAELMRVTRAAKALVGQLETEEDQRLALAAVKQLQRLRRLLQAAGFPVNKALVVGDSHGACMDIYDGLRDVDMRYEEAAAMAKVGAAVQEALAGQDDGEIQGAA